MKRWLCYHLLPLLLDEFPATGLMLHARIAAHHSNQSINQSTLMLC